MTGSDPVPGFTALETAALRAIFAETPQLVAVLEAQLAAAAVTERTNSGAGFRTTIIVPAGVARASCPAALGNEAHARVDGLKYGLGFSLAMADGRLHRLDAASYAEETAGLDLWDADFTIGPMPFDY